MIVIKADSLKKQNKKQVNRAYIETGIGCTDTLSGRINIKTKIIINEPRCNNKNNNEAKLIQYNKKRE